MKRRRAMILPEGITHTILGILSLQSFYALLLFPVIWVLVTCFRGRNPRWQHGLWLLILLRLVLPPDMASSWSAGNLVRSLASHSISRDYFPFQQESFRFQDPGKPPVASSYRIHKPDGQDSFKMVSKIGRPRPTVVAPSPLNQFGLIIGGVYLFAVTLLLVRFFSTRCRYRKIAGQGKTVQDPVVMDIVRTWSRRLHIRRAVKVKAVGSGVPTYTMGLLRPVVILPEQLISSGGRGALESVLAHELVHVKRYDDLSICLQELVKIIYFFNPVVWFVMPRLTWTREAVCDGTVLAQGTISPRTYGKQLIAFVSDQALPRQSARALAVFTSAAKGMAFRLHHIRKEDHVKSNPILNYLAVMVLGLFLLPMAPVASPSQVDATDDRQVSPAVDRNSRPMAYHVLTEYILACVPCQNPEEVAQAIWGDLIEKDFQTDDFSRLIAATDCDVLENIGDGQKAYVFYLLSSSRKGVYRPNFHFVMKKDKLKLLYKSPNLSTYATHRPKVNGRYEIEEGWRADLLNGMHDQRVKLAWGSSVWFWSGTQYLKAYTEYTIQKASDPSLLGTKRKWETDIRSVYEAAPRK